MKSKRTEVVKVRLTEDEHKELTAAIADSTMPKRGLSELIRNRLFSSSRREAAHVANCKHCRLLAMTSNNLNLIARRAELILEKGNLVELLAHLNSLEREIQRQTHQGEGN